MTSLLRSVGAASFVACRASSTSPSGTSKTCSTWKMIRASSSMRTSRRSRPSDGRRSGSKSSSTILSNVISKMNDGRGPDVLGLCEVENRKVVEMLVAKLAPLGSEVRNRPPGFAERPRHRLRLDLRRERSSGCRIQSFILSMPKKPATSLKPGCGTMAPTCSCSSITGRRGTTTNGSA